MFGHLKINCAIATRYDQLANSFLGIATARYWLKFVRAAYKALKHVQAHIRCVERRRAATHCRAAALLLPVSTGQKL